MPAGGEGTDAVIEGRRNTDMASAIAIAELRVEMRSLTQTTKDAFSLLTNSLDKMQGDQVSTATSVRFEVKESILDLKRELMEDLKEHTHNDLAPHQATLGRRLISLENSRTYMKGVLAVLSVAIPVATAFLTKWIGG